MVKAGRKEGGKWHLLDDDLACRVVGDGFQADDERDIDVETYREQAIYGGSKVTKDRTLAELDPLFTHISEASGPYAHPDMWCRWCQRELGRIQTRRF